jgi:hypothetical protein
MLAQASVAEMEGQLISSYNNLLGAFHNAKDRYIENHSALNELEKVGYAMTRFAERHQKEKEIKSVLEELFQIRKSDPFSYPVLSFLRFLNKRKGYYLL